jgi:hypothetical protein
MENNLVDLRWILLNRVAEIDNIDFWQKIFLCLCFMFFFSTSLIYLVSHHIPALKKRAYLFSDITFIISIILFIGVGRWASLLPSSLNPDEAQFIATATKIFKSPFYWKSADRGIEIFDTLVLTLPGLLGFRIEYASARVVGILLNYVSVLSLYYTLAIIYNKLIARIAIFWVVVIFATMQYPEFVHYGSEYIATGLISLSILIICCNYINVKNNNILIFFSGLLIGSIIFGKEQGAPIAFSLVIVATSIIWQKTPKKSEFIKSFIFLGIGLLSCPIVILIYLLTFSLFNDFWSDLTLLFYYVSHGLDKVHRATKLSDYTKFIFTQYDSTSFFMFVRIMLFVSTPVLVFFRRYKTALEKRSETFPFLFYSLFVLLVSLYAVLKPGTNFDHYLIFLIVPCGFSIGVCMGELQSIIAHSKPNNKQSIFIFVLSLFLLIYIVGGGYAQALSYIENQYSISYQSKQILSNYRSPVEKAILKYVSPGESMAVWGWAAELYVDTNTIMGVRYAMTQWEIVPHPQQKYFMQRYIDDIVKSQPAVFVDAVSPKMFYYHDRQTEGHEAFPELARVVAQNYKLVDEVDGVRIYKFINKVN